ncbi:hypothetical protein HanXRQr2_Chr04g0179591 [Helianthus annuus]|uniref:Uncharacterized protein n=1 Tax=Helianthus annuus TaxID=4232 RepID=A0A9K3JA85_HELAN|nr:hypothetical protein HanXRQr2_Chr04g0179591 [Helianthus annuus]
MIVKTKTFRTKRRSCEHSVRKLTWASGTVVRSEERPCISDKPRPGGDERPVQRGVQDSPGDARSCHTLHPVRI